MRSMRCATILCCGLLVALVLTAPEGRAQARKAAAPPATPRDKVTIRKLEGIGQAARIKTPEYSVSTSESAPTTRDWARILVQFETDADWTDELEFRYFAQVRNPKTNRDLLFTGNFSYIDIPKGRHHQCSVFLHPTTLARHGDILGVAVEIYAKGELVALACNPETPKGWWRLATVKTVPGVLLERSQTPFVFVAYDMYVTAKPK